MKLTRRVALSAAVAGLMLASYSVGVAQGPGAGAKLDQAYDLLVKARATLNSVSTRSGAGDIASAKASIDKALGKIEKARAVNPD